MNRSLLSALAVAGALALPFGQPAQAAVTTTMDLVTVVDGGGGSFTFTSGGWAGGGTVTGSFSGTDGDADGQLSSFDGEISAFAAAYSGGAIVGPVSWVLGDLFGLVYDFDGDIGDGLILDVEGIGAVGGGATFTIGPGPVGLCGAGTVCGIIDGPAAGVVSEAPMLPLMLAGLALLAGMRRRAD